MKKIYSNISYEHNGKEVIESKRVKKTFNNSQTKCKLTIDLGGDNPPRYIDIPVLISEAPFAINLKISWGNIKTDNIEILYAASRKIKDGLFIHHNKKAPWHIIIRRSKKSNVELYGTITIEIAN